MTNVINEVCVQHSLDFRVISDVDSLITNKGWIQALFPVCSNPPFPTLLEFTAFKISTSISKFSFNLQTSTKAGGIKTQINVTKMLLEWCMYGTCLVLLWGLWHGKQNVESTAKLLVILVSDFSACTSVVGWLWLDASCPPKPSVLPLLSWAEEKKYNKSLVG